MSKYGIALATAGLSLIMAGEASAGITTYSFTGVVDYEYGCDSKCNNYGARGSSVTGSITFNTDSLSYPDSGQAGLTQENLSNVATAYSINFSSDLVSSYNSSGTNGDLGYRIANDWFQTYWNSSIDIFRIAAGSFEVDLMQSEDGTSASMFSGNSMSILQPFAVDLASLNHNSRAFSNSRQTWVSFQVTDQSFSVSEVPEPGSLPLLLAALGLMGVATSRRKIKPA